MSNARFPLTQLAKGVRDPKSLTEDEIRLIISCFSDWREEAISLGSRLITVTQERDRLQIENNFLCRLIDVKSEG